MNRILILDDEPAVTHALDHALRRAWPHKARIEVFNDPISALHRAENTIFDVVISDLRMPEMDGIVFLQAIKALQPQATRMVLGSASELDAIKPRLNELGDLACLAKPWDEARILQHIGQALGLHDGQPHQVQDDALRGVLTPQAQEARRLEELEPGITQVDWGPQGEVLMPPLDVEAGASTGWPKRHTE